jgi:hypothetical protein
MDYIDLDEMAGVDIVGATAVQRGQYSIENLVAGFPASASIGAGGTDNTTLVPVRPIRAAKLFLDAGFTVAECAVDQLRVGAVNQNIGNGPLPGSMFTGDSVAPPLRGDTIQPNVGAVLTLINNTAGAITDVTKAILGPAAVA